MKRPTIDGNPNGSLCSTPSAATSITLLGGSRYEGVTVTRDERDSLERLYGFDLDAAADDAREFEWSAHATALAAHKEAMAKRSKWDPLLPTPTANPDGVARLAREGALRNLFRHAEADGLRMVAVAARYLEPGEDPVKFLLSLMERAGMDVREDPDWYNGSEEEDL